MTREAPQAIRLNVPYYCQWESRSLVSDLLSGSISANADPNWPSSGALSPADYQFWSWNVCGMACLKMILAAVDGSAPPTIVLARQCEQYGGYVVRGDKIDGLYYRPFLEFIRLTYELQGLIAAPMQLTQIADAVAERRFVIVSVSPEIRDPTAQATKKGGHLALVVGYDWRARKLIIHNPSGDSIESQEYAEIRLHDFERFFANRGIIIWR